MKKTAGKMSQNSLLNANIYLQQCGTKYKIKNVNKQHGKESHIYKSPAYEANNENLLTIDSLFFKGVEPRRALYCHLYMK